VSVIEPKNAPTAVLAGIKIPTQTTRAILLSAIPDVFLAVHAISPINAVVQTFLIVNEKRAQTLAPMSSVRHATLTWATL
jgi:hypothetical protein